MRSRARSEPEHLSIHHFPLTREQLEYWDGICIELVNDLLHSHPTGAILYVDNLPIEHEWRYHAALVLDGIVYDAWHPAIKGYSPADYTRIVFGPKAEFTIFDDSDD